MKSARSGRDAPSERYFAETFPTEVAGKGGRLRNLALELPDAIVLTRRYLDLVLGVHLLVLALAAFTPVVYANPGGVQIFGLVSAAVIVLARLVCVRGHPARGMMIYAIYEWLALATVAALAGQPLMYAIPSIGFAPLLAVVVGVRAAALFAGSSFLFTVCAQLARSFDVGLPLPFPGTTAVMGLLAFIALITVLFPLPMLVRVVNNALADMSLALDDARDAKQEAEAANRAKSDFLAIMSHEIRTPIHGIVGLTRLALEGPLSAGQREHLTAVQESADGLLSIISDILDLSKIEARQMQLEAIPFDLVEVLSGVLKVVSFNASAKGVNLTLDIAPDVPRHVIGDPTRVRQVVLNLVGNAIKFTEQGSVAVRVRLAQQDAQGRTLRFEVQDSGIGIPADKRDAIFEPFSQVDSSTTRRYGGTGLGLTICRRLVQMMGGEIGVDSTVGVGSTFHFTARLELASHAQLEKRAAAKPLQRKLNILLVEDRPVNQMLAVMLLERAGHHVSVAASGLEGVEQWRSINPDLILMDMRMPDMDGLEATRRIRAAEAAEKLPRTPIIAMTANAFAEDRDACLAAGMDAYLSKPVKPEALEEAIAVTE